MMAGNGGLRSRRSVVDTANRRKRGRRGVRRLSSPLSLLHRSSSSSDDASALFSLMLASISKFQDSSSSSNSLALTLIRNCLIRLRLSLISKAHCPILTTEQQVFPSSILSLIPVIVNSRFVDIASLGVNVVGAASLRSFELNQQIASDGDIVKSLLLNLSSSSKKMTTAVCSSVLDLSTSSIGRQRLLDFSALEILINCFLQGHNCSVESATVDDGRINKLITALKEDEAPPTLLLDAITTLVNSCNKQQLERISVKLVESFLGFLKQLWSSRLRHGQTLVPNALECNQQGRKCLKNWSINDLAACIFRLAIAVPHAATVYPIEVIKEGIFGLHEASFENFVENHWETSPFFMKTIQSSTSNDNCNFWSVLNPLHSKKEAIPQFVTWLLQNMVSCPPIASDELDILNYLKQERDKLGIPIAYIQDIRVLKMEENLNQEIHFFHKSCSQGPHVLSCHDITKCEEALRNGYTIALRGMELRLKSIAGVTEGLASLFGQPSVGANLYLTPPNSQGLARHYDDHCVFVCQLMGTKQWTIVPSKVKLPRLYDEPIDQDTCSSSGIDGSMQILLKEGDILYIPRGFVHEAHTTDVGGVKEGCDGWSLHLTLSVEVEPPFEWEGFTHIALVCWVKKLKLKQQHLLSVELPEDGGLCSQLVSLLHMMIVSLGEADPLFRRACLVGSVACSSSNNNNMMSQRETFCDLINRIFNSESSRVISQVVARLEMDIQQNVDPLKRIRWLQIVEEEEEEEGGDNIMSVSVSEIAGEDILSWCNDEDRETCFQVLKSKFCKEVMFEDVVSSYLALLHKYKEVRMQYVNGMLPFHHRIE